MTFFSTSKVIYLRQVNTDLFCKLEELPVGIVKTEPRNNILDNPLNKYFKRDGRSFIYD